MINVGTNLVAGIEDLLQVATDRDKPVVVLTNGGSFETSMAAEKYAKWRLPIMPDAVVSSRDVLHCPCRSATISPMTKPGYLGAVVTPYLETMFWPTANKRFLEHSGCLCASRGN